MTPKIQTIAVIGAGQDGRELAFAAARARYRTILEDVSDIRLEDAVAWIGSNDRDVASRLVLSRTVEAAVREADLIIEAVADEVEMKIEMFTILDKFAKPGAIFASSSRLVPIAELATMTFCPERCIGIRFLPGGGQFDAMDLVRAPQTSDETVARCREALERMGKEIKIVIEREFMESR
jgi:3-hydroxybutyryl-CoA dehydrogenase